MITSIARLRLGELTLAPSICHYFCTNLIMRINLVVEFEGGRSEVMQHLL